jgi:hypothetical protein
LWQVSGRSDLSWTEAVRLDLSYVDNWSMVGDLMTIAKTLAERVRTDVGSAIFWGIAFVPVIVFLTTPRIVLQDGGLHLSSAVAWRRAYRTLVSVAAQLARDPPPPI